MASGDFNYRQRIGAQFESDVEAYCSHVSDAVAKNGTEHTHPDFVALLRGNNDTTSKMIRFAPDGVLLRAGGVTHWEAKCSTINSDYINLEKDAYETYIKYHYMGCSVFVFFKHPIGDVYGQYVEKIGFVPSEDVVGRFPPHMRYPIDEDDWITPRRSANGKRGSGSGTPYREVDVQSLKPITTFYGVVEARRNAAA